MSGNVHHATLVAQRPLAPDVVEYRFALAAPLAFRAGQFISVTCGERDGNPILRSYSIASRPGAGELVLVLKLVDGPGSRLFRGLAAGDAIRFSGPIGFFCLEPVHPGDVLFVATGTGVAPMVPMIEEALARGDRGAIHLLWGLRREEDRFWGAELARLEAGGVRVAVHLSQPSPSFDGLRGRVIAPALALLPRLESPTFYLCGNGAMIRELKAALVARGVDRKRQIRAEAFFD